MAWNVENLRDILKNKTKYRYSEKWHRKVECMSAAQVIAVYNRMLIAKEIRK